MGTRSVTKSQAKKKRKISNKSNVFYKIITIPHLTATESFKQKGFNPSAIVVKVDCNGKTATTANQKGQITTLTTGKTAITADKIIIPTQQSPSQQTTNFSQGLNRNFSKIRQHDPDVSPRPRRPYQNDPSSRYYNKSDGIGQGKIIGDNDNSNIASGCEGGGGGSERYQQYTRSGSPTEQLNNTKRSFIGVGGNTNSNNNSGGASGRYENGKSNGVQNEYPTKTTSSINGGNNIRRGPIGGRNSEAGGGNTNCLERGQPAALKTEAPRQTGPESRVPGRDKAIPPASRRWVPPSLRPQNGLTQEAKNDAIFRKVRGILNKLTPEKFQELSDDLLKIDLNSAVILNGVIYLIFEKALDEPKYSSMYAQLCKRLSKEAPNFDSPSPNNTVTFSRLLLNVCRDKFLNRSTTSEYIIHDGRSLSPEEEEKRHVAKQRMLGNVKFIGELSKLEMLSSTVLHKCIQQLLETKSRQATTIQDRCEDMECLSQLIRTCGKNLDNEQGKKLMDQYFENLDQRSKSHKYPPRIRFMLRDIIELRNNNWIPRKVGTTEDPVPIRQIRTDDDNIIRPTYINRNRDMRNNERDSDNWMNRFSLNLQPGFNDMFSSLGVSSSSPIMSPGGYSNNNRHHNQRNNQNNHHNNYNNRYNKHNNHNQHNNSHNNSYSNMMNNKDLAPRFKRNLITAAQDPVENLQMRPAANSLLFKANVNVKTLPLLPISTPPPSVASVNLTSGLTLNHITLSINHTQNNRAASAPGSDVSINSNKSSQNSIKSNQSSIVSAIGGGSSGNNGNIGANNSSTEKTPINNNILNKELPIIKQNSTEKPIKQGKKDKGPNKEEILKRVQTFLNEELIIDPNNDKNIDDIVAKFYEIKVPDKFMKETCVTILNEIIDKSEQQYERCIEFLQQLRKDNKLNSNAMLDAFRQIINKMNEKEVTIPRITTFVASLLARAVSAKLCKISDISSYTENGQHYPLFLLVLQQLHKTMGKNDLAELFTKSKINLMTSLPEADRNKDRMAEILDDRNLGFLYPLLKLQAEMLKQIQTEPNPQTFYKWIKGNVDSKYYTDTGFITALMIVILKYITQETTLTEGTDPKKYPDKLIIEKEQNLLVKYCNVLNAFLSGNNDLQLVAVYALQVFCHNAGFPKGMLCRWFKNLYEANAIEEDAFIRWKEEVTEEYPGKGEALFQVNTWLTWLELAESEDED